MTTTAKALEALHDALPRVGEPENVWCSVKGSDIRSVVQHIESTAAEIARLQAECEALRKDAARLDSGCIMMDSRDEFGDGMIKCEHRGVNLRAAIDEAITNRKV